MKWFKDGNQLCIVSDKFVDLQESDAIFVDLHREIVREILEEKENCLNLKEVKSADSSQQ